MTRRLAGPAGATGLAERAGETIRLARGAADMAGDIGRLVSGFAGVTEAFNDLDFTEPGGTLELRRRVQQVTCLRIELPTVDALQLASVVVDADGVDDFSAETTSTASSLSKNFQQALQQGFLFDPDNTETAMRTTRQQRPWLEFAFEHPVMLQRIRLRNVPDHDELGLRNRGIQVLVRSADGCWSTIYDGVERERLFVQAVERRYAGQTLPQRARARVGRLLGRTHEGEQQLTDEDLLPAVCGGDLAKILTGIRLGDYTNADADLGRLDLSPAQKTRFRALVNERIAGRQLEWNLHGISRTFRFWSEQERSDYVGFAADVVDCLRDLNDNVCFGFGTALAIVRDQELIPHDNDADVIIGFDPSQASTLREGRKLIRQCLQDHGYRVSKSRVAHHWVQPSGGGPKLDAFAGIFEGDVISWYPGNRGRLTRQMMFPPQYWSFLGHSCPVPHEPKRYLEQIYGPDWKTPDPHFRHNLSQIRRQYKDIRD